MDSNSKETLNSYESLTVWQKSMTLTVEVYKIVKLLPKDETYGLSDQMRRAAVSIPSNIAEGQGRSPGKDFIRFLYIARGSCYELQTQLKIAEKIGYLTKTDIKQALSLSEEISKMIYSLIVSIQNSIIGL